jgi:hypothetical protein
MNNPGSPTAIIADLIPRVQAALQNNPNVNESQKNPEMRPSAWIRDALREITESNPFEELRVPDPPLVTIGPGLGINGSNYKYFVSAFLNSGDDLTIMEDPVIFLNQALTGPGTPNTANTVAYPMDYLTPKAIAPLLNIQGGIPFKYTRFGTQFWFGTQPNTNFFVYLPYQLRHPFVDTNLPSSAVHVPPSWFDIIAYAAAERGAIANRWNDQATFIHTLLYGDPASQMKDGQLARPGLIAARTLQQERDRRLSTVQITPMVQRY